LVDYNLEGDPTFCLTGDFMTILADEGPIQT